MGSTACTEPQCLYKGALLLRLPAVQFNRLYVHIAVSVLKSWPRSTAYFIHTDPMTVFRAISNYLILWSRWTISTGFRINSLPSNSILFSSLCICRPIGFHACMLHDRPISFSLIITPQRPLTSAKCSAPNCSTFSVLPLPFVFGPNFPISTVFSKTPLPLLLTYAENQVTKT